jgi:hypothetical protein
MVNREVAEDPNAKKKMGFKVQSHFEKAFAPFHVENFYELIAVVQVFT